MKQELEIVLKANRAAHLSYRAIERESVTDALREIAGDLGVPYRTWNVATGGGLPNRITERGLYVIEEALGLMDAGGAGRVAIESALSGWYGRCHREGLYTVLLDYRSLSLPSYLAALYPTVSVPLPGSAEIAALLGERLGSNDDGATTAATGLSLAEIAVGLELARGRGGDPLEGLAEYKRDRLREAGLEFLAAPDVSDFGGLERLRAAIERVKLDYSDRAREYNIPFPRGWLLAGPPGTGKTHTAKVCAAILGFPLLNVGIDAVKARGTVYLKGLLERIEAAAPAVCYLDELDKFFDPDTGANGSGKSKEVLGVLLTWLQEKRSKTFVIATLNRLDALPPELTRAGRFDRIFYVGFPTPIERVNIIKLHAERFDRRYKEGNGPLSDREWRVLLGRTGYCTGAELRQIVEEAARCRFYAGDGRIDLGLEDFLKARSGITPLYTRDTERVLAMANRARGVAEPASEEDTSIYAPLPTNLWGETVNGSNH
jgi:ATPase family associated with various cellular activities (AAA)